MECKKKIYLISVFCVGVFRIYERICVSHTKNLCVCYCTSEVFAWVVAHHLRCCCVGSYMLRSGWSDVKHQWLTNNRQASMWLQVCECVLVVCVCVCVCACVRACMRACVCVCVHEWQGRGGGNRRQEKLWSFLQLNLISLLKSTAKDVTPFIWKGRLYAHI